MMEITEEVKQILGQSNGPLGIVEAIEISHSKWPKVLRYVSNSNMPLTLTHENGKAYCLSESITKTLIFIFKNTLPNSVLIHPTVHHNHSLNQTTIS